MSLTNHSCAPNVLVDMEDSFLELEVRATKDISKGEEVTTCYTRGFMTSSQMKKDLQEFFNFDCKCGVCAGVIPHQDKIIREILKIYDVNLQQPVSLYQKKMKGWMIEASKYERAAHLTKQLYIGEIASSLNIYAEFIGRSQMARDPIRLEKAMNVMKEELSAFGLIETRLGKGYKSLQTKVERWSSEFQSKRRPTKEEIDDFFILKKEVERLSEEVKSGIKPTKEEVD